MYIKYYNCKKLCIKRLPQDTTSKRHQDSPEIRRCRGSAETRPAWWRDLRRSTWRSFCVPDGDTCADFFAWRNRRPRRSHSAWTSRSLVRAAATGWSCDAWWIWRSVPSSPNRDSDGADAWSSAGTSWRWSARNRPPSRPPRDDPADPENRTASPRIADPKTSPDRTWSVWSDNIFDRMCPWNPRCPWSRSRRRATPASDCSRVDSRTSRCRSRWSTCGRSAARLPTSISHPWSRNRSPWRSWAFCASESFYI